MYPEFDQMQLLCCCLLTMHSAVKTSAQCIVVPLMPSVDAQHSTSQHNALLCHSTDAQCRPVPPPVGNSGGHQAQITHHGLADHLGLTTIVFHADYIVVTFWTFWSKIFLYLIVTLTKKSQTPPAESCKIKLNVGAH